MGGSQKQTQQQTQTNTIDPESKALLMGNYDTAKQNGLSLTTPYTGQLTAGFTPTQTQAQGILGNLATNPIFGNQIQTAANSVQGVLGQDTFGQANIEKYFNPYQNDVINATISDQDRARQIAQVHNAQQDSAGSAFGGSRSGVSRALVDEGYDRNTGTLLANLNDQGWNQAAQMAQQDVQNRLGAAGQLVNTAGAGYGQALQQGGLLANVGDVQQAQQQKEYDNAYQAWLQGKALTVQQQNLLNSALGMIPVQQTVNSNGTSTTSSNPGLGGILSSIGKIGMGIAAL